MLIVLAAQVPVFANPWNRVFFLGAVFAIIMSVERRKYSIGGFLFYFYYWELALLVVYLKDIALNPRVFLPSAVGDGVNHGALMLAVFPRFFAILAVVVVSLRML